MSDGKLAPRPERSVTRACVYSPIAHPGSHKYITSSLFLVPRFQEKKNRTKKKKHYEKSIKVHCLP